MTQEEIISNLSYTASDFRTIYPQLLDTAKKLTNKWDPSLSNESDPGNILIKEAAIVGDKNNYHIDKSVLECFPLSATQQSSARQLYDLVGYNMHWYRSAKGQITFNLIRTIDAINTLNKLEGDNKLTSITIKAGTVVSDSSGEYVYTLLKSTEPIDTINKTYTTEAIQGIINPYEINGNTTITIDNIDENLRIYLPQNIVSENGVFVYQAGSDVSSVGYINKDIEEGTSAWELVDNITKYPSKSRVFEFGIDINSDNCYIQFPEDIISSDLIGSGLNIYYTTTIGVRGNLNKGLVNKFLSNYEVSTKGENTVVVNNYIVISNNPTAGGSDPETLEAAYKSYKRLIGTYDTLVTRKDYENAIYNLNNDSDTGGLISNSLVTDRTTDINFSQKVVEGNLGNNTIRNYVYKNTEGDFIIQPYDVVLYLLKSPNAMNNITDFKESFDPDLTGSTISSIKNDLDKLKSVQHDLYYVTDLKTDKTSSALYFDINNLCKLTGTLTTYYKISKTDAEKIQDNVTKALITKYNSRAIDFGEELDYNELIDTIKSADDRVRTVSLNIPSYEPELVYADGTKKSLYKDTSIDINNETVAKMLLAGNIQLFNFDHDFRYDFGQTNNKLIENIAYIHTENLIEIGTEDFKSLEENDIVQVITPNLVTKETYSATVKYLTSFSPSTSELKDGNYVLKDGEQLKFIYLNNNIKISKLYKTGTLIKLVGITSLTLPTSIPDPKSDQWKDNTTYSGIISSGQSIEIKEISQINIKKGTPYYIISQNKSNGNYTIEIPANDNYMLKENEYLLYTNNTLDGLVTLGSGTTLINSTISSVLLISPEISLEDILTTEVSEAGNKWQILPEDIKAQENSIINLVGGSSIKVNSGVVTCKNTLQELPEGTEFIYKLDSSSQEESVSSLNIPGYSIQYRSNMILTGNSIVPQELKGVQRIKFLNELGEIITGSIEFLAPTCLLYNYPINQTGGDKANVLVFDEVTNTYKPELKVYTYTPSNMISAPESLKIEPLERKEGILTLKASEVKDNLVTLNFDFKGETSSDYKGYYMLPISLNIIKGNALEIGTTSTKFKILKTLKGNEETSIDFKAEKDNISEVFTLIIKPGTEPGAEKDNLTIKFENQQGDESTIFFGYMKKVLEVNSSEINSEDIGINYYKYSITDNSNLNKVIDKVETKASSLNTIYDWSYEPDIKNKVLQPLSARSYFNPNHIYNKCTISKIDFDNSSIKVNSLSIE